MALSYKFIEINWPTMCESIFEFFILTIKNIAITHKQKEIPTGEFLFEYVSIWLCIAVYITIILVNTSVFYKLMDIVSRREIFEQLIFTCALSFFHSRISVCSIQSDLPEFYILSWRL